MLTGPRGIQLPVLATVLLIAAVAKAWTVRGRGRSGAGSGVGVGAGGAGAVSRAVSRAGSGAGLGPGGLIPVRWSGPAVLAFCAVEVVLAGLLLAASGPLGALARAGTAVLFAVAAFALIDLRARRPGAGCGCFGELSGSPVRARTIGRAALLALAAVAAIGVPGRGVDALAALTPAGTALLAAEIAVLAALCPEIGVLLDRFGYREPCERRRMPVRRSLAALRASRPWHAYAADLVDHEPVDVWRERCWRFAVFPGVVGGRPVDVVFAIYIQTRRPPVRVAVLDARTAEVLVGAGRPPRIPAGAGNSAAGARVGQ